MAYTTARDWVTDEVVTAALMNQYIRDNQDALKDPPSANYNMNEVANDTTTSATFGDVDGTNLSLTIVTTGGDVMAGFTGSVAHSSASGLVMFDIDVDGVRTAGDDGIVVLDAQNAAASEVVGFVYLVTGLSAASHTFKLQWKTSAATATLWTGAGTANKDVHPQFWVREVS